MKHYDLVLIETKCPIGHINYYKCLFEHLISNGFSISFITTKEYAKKFDFDSINIYTVESFSFSNIPRSLLLKKSLYRLNQFFMLVAASSILTTISYDRCIFLSYEIISFAILSKIKKLYCAQVIEHNTIDSTLNSTIKSFFYNIIDSKIEHLCFESFISEFIKLRYNKKSSVIPHYVRNLTVNTSKKTLNNFVFCPSADVDSDFLFRLYEFCKLNRFKLYIKSSHGLSNDEVVISRDYFDDYDDLFLSANYIAVGCSFNYRVSAVFYEALQNNNNIIFNDCLFSRNVSEMYKGEINYVFI